MPFINIGAASCWLYHVNHLLFVGGICNLTEMDQLIPLHTIQRFLTWSLGNTHGRLDDLQSQIIYLESKIEDHNFTRVERKRFRYARSKLLREVHVSQNDLHAILNAQREVEWRIANPEQTYSLIPPFLANLGLHQMMGQVSVYPACPMGTIAPTLYGHTTFDQRPINVPGNPIVPITPVGPIFYAPIWSSPSNNSRGYRGLEEPVSPLTPFSQYSNDEHLETQSHPLIEHLSTDPVETPNPKPDNNKVNDKDITNNNDLQAG